MRPGRCSQEPSLPRGRTSGPIIEKVLRRGPASSHAAPDAGITLDDHHRHVDHAGHLGDDGQEAAGTATTSPGAPAQPRPAQRHTDHEGHAPAGAAHSPYEMMGHGGHAGMSMDDMVRDMRNRFVVAAVLAVAIMVGAGLAAKRGILFTNATALETSARIDTVVMDKTGTLTKGTPEVTRLIAAEPTSLTCSRWLPRSRRSPSTARRSRCLVCR